MPVIEHWWRRLRAWWSAPVDHTLYEAESDDWLTASDYKGAG